MKVWLVTGWGFGGMWFLTILFWLVVIGGVIFIAKGFVSPKNTSLPPPPDDSPINILKKRFAKGEIDEETFNNWQTYKPFFISKNS